ncbi:MAG: tetratricopeptide repeat protein [Planctomycetota bacterium]|nr:tetratricopeptide repeat protein [Planctomycetota bacterium]
MSRSRTHRMPISSLISLTLLWMGSLGAQQPPTHVGRAVCASCHQGEHSRWSGSHHDLSMLEVSDPASRAPFDGTEVSSGGVLSRFLQVDERPVIEVEDSSGKKTLPVRYFFGTSPCQQVLVEGEKGRLQSFPIAWATPEAAGGARWYPLFPDEKTPAGDPLHWSGVLNNWNHMCAECHSTGMVKNYDLESDSFNTHWQELDVSCEACHGPGSDHVTWAKATKEEREEPRYRRSPKGLPVQFHRDQATWVRPAGEKVARRSPKRIHHDETETCARCHSRRTALVDGSVPGTPLSETHLLSLLDTSLYHPDGQILDEVYVHGSFLQSRMYAEGVTCSDCHEPHGGKLHIEGNSLCIGCHDPAIYDLPSHHHHTPKSTGASCIECHMVSRTYMGVDPRRDHSFRVPRPDLSIRIGTPNACNDCHQDKENYWAAEKVREWFPDGRSGDFHWGEALHAARNNSPVAPELIRMVLEDEKTPGIVRATALAELTPFLNRTNSDLLSRSFTDSDPLVRRQAALALDGLPLEQTYGVLLDLLRDSSRIVRTVAAELLSPIQRELSADPQGAGLQLSRVLAEYISMQEINGDRPESHVNLGALATRRGDIEEAIRCYQEALKRTPSFGPASVNLADAFRTLDRDAEGIEVLQQAIERVPDDAGLHHALGLALVRVGKKEQALVALAQAVQLAPQSPRYALVHAVALDDGGQTKQAIAALQKARLLHPDDRWLKAAHEEFLNKPETTVLPDPGSPEKTND